jgi:polar amino acid transport system substrate-binding protein
VEIIKGKMKIARVFPKTFLRCIGMLLPVLALASAAGAQNPSEKRVAVSVIAPFIMQDNGLTGFNIDLWNAVAQRLNWKTDYELFPYSAALLEAMRSKKVDIVASPVVITAARDAEFDFSLPILESGLQIMVRDTGEAGTSNPLEALVRLLFSKTAIVWLGIAFVLVLIPAHIVWLFERRHQGGIIDDTRYFPGIFQALHWALSCLTTQAESMPHQRVARTLSLFWMFAGVVFVSFYTAQLTTTLTVNQIKGAINGPADLPGKRVGTLANSTAANYLRTHGALVVEFPQLDQAYSALLDKKLDAVVFGAPELLYYASHEGEGLVRVVGSEFDPSQVAFLYQLDSPLRKQVDGAMLGLREDGTYQRLYAKWFGNQ